MNGLKTSFKTFVQVRTKIQPKLKQPIKVRGNWLIRNGMRKCLECRGIPRIKIGGNGRLAGFYSVNQEYPHRNGCSNN